MKILLLSDGQSVHTKRWVSALKVRGIDVVLYSITPIVDNFYTQLGICPYSFDLFSYKKTNSLVKSLINHIKGVKLLKKIIKNEKPDILHSHYLTSYSLIASFSNFHPFVVSMWGSDIYSFPRQSFVNRIAVKRVLNRSDRILSTSYSMAEEAKKLTNKRILITPFGVDISLFKKYPKKDNVFRIGTVKTLSKNYGINHLIDSFKILDTNNPLLECRLEIVGDGEDMEKLKDQVKMLGLDCKVLFRGKVENSLLPSVYSRFSVAVFLSLRESFGVSAIEAMSCEVPVVATRTDGFREVIDENVNGIIVPIGDPAGAAAAIQRFIDEPSLIKKYGEEGRKKVEKHYNWNDNVSLMISIYKDLISKN